MAKTGDRILNRFTVTHKLSSDTVTHTYLADDSEGGAVSVLEIPVETLDSWDTISQYEKRAEQYSELSCASLPKFIGYYSDESSQSPAIYFVQEHVEGSSLVKLSETTGPLSAEEVRKMLKDLLKGLSLLHRLSPPAVHGGIRPDTIVRNEAGMYRFAALPLPVPGAARSARFNGVAGRDVYVPREQQNGRIEKPSDIYSLGMSALYATTGKHPEVQASKRSEPARGTEYPSGTLGRMFEVMIEPDIAYRSLSAAELLSRLSAIDDVSAGEVPGETAGTRRSTVQIVTTDFQDTVTVYNPDASRPENMLIGFFLDIWASKPWLIILIAAALSAGPIAIVLIIFLFHPKSKALLNRAYAKVKDVYLTLGRHSLSVSDQLTAVEYTDISSYDIRELPHPSGIRLETVLYMRNGKEARFYVNSLNREEARRIANLIATRIGNV